MAGNQNRSFSGNLTVKGLQANPAKTQELEDTVPDV